MRIALPLAFTAFALASCATVPPEPKIRLNEQQTRGLAYAKANCSGCHGIVADASSPNPEAPSFEAVVNTGDLTPQTLEAFLRDSHNFPGAMAFSVDPAKVSDITAYMVTLRRENYRPAI